ncbi:DUF5677 domain-containing protein [Staphylococcus equorum]|uniref:DUF5677 domain-containing protein n=1 Tax=Staphylococcus equorum TaxID=246432 RepID=UPI002556A674|nr:DUF5677 domain-containing protein [Staphylococcus equorum]MDK9864247.1 DUF5677 domain-containing protein [Staphylococcus equorum]
MEKHPLKTDYNDFKQVIDNYFSELSIIDDINLNDLHLANYNLLKEIDDIYDGYCTLYKCNKIENLPPLTRILFERLIYLLYINQNTEEPKIRRAERYLDRTVYETQKFHEYLYDNSNNNNSNKIRDFFGTDLFNSNMVNLYTPQLLNKAKNKYELNFQEVKKIKNHKWYEYTDKYFINKKGEGQPLKLMSFRDLCDYLGYPVFYHICYKNFSSNVHTAASLREEIYKSLRLNTTLKKPSYYNLSISLTNIIIGELLKFLK